MVLIRIHFSFTTVSFDVCNYMCILFSQYAPLDMQLLLVGHMCDLESEREISYDEGKRVS